MKLPLLIENQQRQPQHEDSKMVKKTEEAQPETTVTSEVAQAAEAEEVTYYRVSTDNVHTSKGKFERGDVLPIEISKSEIRLLGDKVEAV